MSYKDIQATAVCFHKDAILIQGASGIGKTRLALQMIERGAKLIGDDSIRLFIKNDKLYCQPLDRLRGVIEVRGLGLVKGFKLASSAPLLCVIRLHSEPVERLPMTKEMSLLGKKIPVFDFYACETNDIQVLYAIRVLKGTFSLLKE